MSTRKPRKPPKKVETRNSEPGEPSHGGSTNPAITSLPKPEPKIVPADRPGPEGGARDRHRRERTIAICDAALALFLEDGITAVTIDQIVKRAGIGKASFYRYFRDKEHLVATLMGPFQKVFADAFGNCDAALQSASSPEAISMAYLAMTLSIAKVVVGSPNLTLLYLQESRSAGKGASRPIRGLADYILEGAVALSEQARKHGLLRDLDPRLGTIVGLGAAERLVYEHLRNNDNDPSSIQASAAMLVTVIVDGVRVR